MDTSIMSNIENCVITRQKDNGACLDELMVVQYLQDNIDLVTIPTTGMLWWYDKGVYRKDGIIKVGQVLKEAFGDVTGPGHKLLLTEKLEKHIIYSLLHRRDVMPEDFDSNKDIINMRNGLYNFRTKEFKPHDTRLPTASHPRYLSMVQIPVDYKPGAECVNFKKSMAAVFTTPGDLLKIREFIAYCLYNDYSIQKAFILYGPADKGKSFIIDHIVQFLGINNCSVVSIKKLCHNNFAGSELLGKLMNTSGELDKGSVKNLSEFKTAIGGTDQMRVEAKGKDAVYFRNRAKFIFGTNSIFSSEDESDGFMRRFEIIKTRIEDLPAGLPTEAMISTDEEMSGLFNYVIDLLEPLINRRKFSNQLSKLEITQDFTRMGKSIESFVEDNVEPGHDRQVITVDDLWTRYVEYCDGHGIYEHPRKWNFLRAVQRFLPDSHYEDGQKHSRSKKEKCLIGYRFKDNEWSGL